MTETYYIRARRALMDAFCGCEECTAAFKEQSSLALEVMDRGTAVGRTRLDFQTPESFENEDDFSYKAGCLE